MVAARWIEPADALAQSPGREFVLPLPTQRILASLSESSRCRRPPGGGPWTGVPARPPAHCPRREGGERILLPQDPGWF